VLGPVTLWGTEHAHAPSLALARALQSIEFLLLNSIHFTLASATFFLFVCVSCCLHVWTYSRLAPRRPRAQHPLLHKPACTSTKFTPIPGLNSPACNLIFRPSLSQSATGWQQSSAMPAGHAILLNQCPAMPLAFRIANPPFLSFFNMPPSYIILLGVLKFKISLPIQTR
jgi:hypothetical protein